MKTGKRLLAWLLALTMMLGYLPAKKAEAASATLTASAERTENVLSLSLTTDSELEFGGLWLYIEGAEDLPVIGADSLIGEVTIGTRTIGDIKYPAFEMHCAQRTPNVAEAGDTIFTADFSAESLQPDQDYRFTFRILEIYDYDDLDHEIGDAEPVTDYGQYTVTFDSRGGSDVEPQLVDLNGTAEEPEAPVRTGYTFAGWMLNGEPYDFSTPVTGPITLIAAWEVNRYTVKFVDEDGQTVLGEKEYDYGTKAEDIERPADPVKAATAQYTYTFSGWTPEIADVTKDATYTAVYSAEINQYTVRFVDEDGQTVLGEKKYDYGTRAEDIERPADPVKPATAQYTYTFSGWTPEIADVTKDATYTAVYSAEINQYTVRFVDEDGQTVLGEKEYDYGTKAEDIERPADPVKAATAQYTYTFSGWTPEIADVTEEATYTAVYSAEINQYTVKFVNEDGTVLQEEKVDYGTVPEYTGEVPAKAEDALNTYEFAGWDKQPVPVTGDAVYTATFRAVPKGYLITVTDLTNGAAASSLVADRLYKGGENFTVSAEHPCLVAIKEADGTYTRLNAAAGSGTHTYTVQVDAPVELVIVFKGDVNLDGEVTSKDASLISKHIVGTADPSLDFLQQLLADANEDGALSSRDANKVSRFLVERDSFEW